MILLLVQKIKMHKFGMNNMSILSFLKKRNIKRNTNFFDLTPIRVYDHEINKNGLVELLIPRFDKNIIGQYLEKKSGKQAIKAELDEIGSKVWLVIDSKKSVFEISKVLREDFIDESKENIESRTVEYMRILYNNGFINLKDGSDKLFK